MARVDHHGGGFLRRSRREALAKHDSGYPTPTRGQFTGAAFTGLLIKNGMASTWMAGYLNFYNSALTGSCSTKASSSNKGRKLKIEQVERQ